MKGKGVHVTFTELEESEKRRESWPAETIVSELMETIQHEIAESVGEDLSAKEQRAIGD
ncbi:MAG: hypothetical protein HYX78_13350 [Armatimonadetes bacterium]|nr:hypothetical protein [Armatimonadota bacterium]